MSVYIAEAHADDEWPIHTRKELRIRQHGTLKERVQSATFMRSYIQWNWPLFVDSLHVWHSPVDFMNRFKAWPLRLFVVQGPEHELVWNMDPKPDDGLWNCREIEAVLDSHLEQQKVQQKSRCIVQ